MTMSHGKCGKHYMSEMNHMQIPDKWMQGVNKMNSSLTVTDNWQRGSQTSKSSNSK